MAYTPEQIQAYGEHLKSLGTYTPEQISDYQTHLTQKFGPGSPGSHPDMPQEGDLFGDYKARTKASFADPAGVTKIVTGAGYSKPQTNKNGELVAQDANGNWVKDAANISSHPINWLESHAGTSLPTAGMVAGGMGTGLLATPETLGAGTLPAAAAGAGAGGAAGEALRQRIGKYLGVNDGSNLDIAKEGVKGAATELGGRVIGKLPIPGTGHTIDSLSGKAVEALLSGGRKAVSKISSAMQFGAVPAADIERLLINPKAVAQASSPEAIASTTKAAGSELDTNLTNARKASQAATDAFMAANGGRAPSQEQLAVLQEHAMEFLARNQPSKFGAGRISPDEWNQAAKEAMGLEQQNAGELLKTAQGYQAGNQARYSGNPATMKSDAMAGQEVSMAGKIKALLHTMDPKYGEADAAYSQFADNAKLLAPLEKENRSSANFAKNLYSPQGAIEQGAAKAVIPKSYSGPLADWRANQAFDKAGALGATPMDKATHVGIPLAMGTAAHSAGTSDMNTALMIGAAVAATSPKVHKVVLGTGAKAVNGAWSLLQKNPQLVPAALGLGNQSSPWSLLPKGNTP